MSSLLIFWLAVGIGFLIFEIITVTFYGLALSIAGFVVAGFVWYTNATEISLIQGILFAIVSFFTSFYLPGLLTPKWEEQAQWLDIYLGEKRKVKKVWEDFKVVLDGIEYIVDIDGVKAWDRVKLSSRKGSIFYGSIIE